MCDVMRDFMWMYVVWCAMWREVDVNVVCMTCFSQVMYLTLAKILAMEQSEEFASLLVETLNLILLTAEELVRRPGGGGRRRGPVTR